MAVITRGFGGRRRDDTDLPPGQYRTDDFSLVPARGVLTTMLAEKLTTHLPAREL